jgi:mRNA degradation ribonuclease J1/J2
MKIYKLNYTDKKTAIADLISKKVIEIVEGEQSYINGTQAVVDCGIIVLTQGTYDEQGAEVIAPIFAEGYHYDVMSSDEIIFENEIIVNNPRFTFAGY